MYKKVLLLLSLVTPMLFSQPALAKAKISFERIYIDCGLGGMIGDQIENRQVGNVTAIISNVTTTFGLIGLISELTTPETCSGSHASVAMFIHQSYDALEKDIASGKGEYLSALKTLSGADLEFEAKLRAAFASEVGNSDYNQLSQYSKSEALYNLVQSAI